MPPAELPDLPALLDRYERPLVRYALSILGDLESARDVVQETFIRWVREDSKHDGRDSGAGSGNLPVNGDPTPDSRPLGFDENRTAAWLFTVCRNRALDYQRKHSRIVPMELPEDRADDEPTPAATLERRDTAASLLRMLDALSPNQREVIRLKFQNDLSYKEIADVTQLSVTNVGFLLHTGLKKLRALLQETPPDDWPIPFTAHRQL